MSVTGETVSVTEETHDESIHKSDLYLRDLSFYAAASSDGPLQQDCRFNCEPGSRRDGGPKRYARHCSQWPPRLRKRLRLCPAEPLRPRDPGQTLRDRLHQQAIHRRRSSIVAAGREAL